MVSKPHGGKLINKKINLKKSELKDLIKIYINNRIASDIINIGYGIYSPLEGFLNSDDYNSVINEMRLSNGLPWTIPIIFDINKENINFKEGDSVLLYYKNNPLAILEIEEIYTYNKKEDAKKLFKTDDINHPGVKEYLQMGDYLIGGEIKLIYDINDEFNKFFVSPEKTREEFKKRGWKTIAAFQTRNVPHIGHEHLQKVALHFVDGIFINPVIGKKKPGDFKDEVIIEAYKTLFKHYYPENTAFLSIVRYSMRYAGPKEAIHHAIMRKNFGCTHFIVGRDHAGVGNYYKPYEAQEMFDLFEDLEIVPLKFKEFFYCKKCGAIVNEKICPHDENMKIYFSGTKIRKLLSNKKLPSYELIRKEVLDVILKYENPFVGD